MDYNKIYSAIIEKRKFNKPEGYSEKHHIIPRSLGGSDNTDNIVSLTAREHFICHYILTKMYEPYTFEWYKMNNAFMMMKCNSANQNRYFNSYLYESLKTDMAKVMSANSIGRKNSQYGTQWIHNKELRKSKKIPNTDDLPTGWKRGRGQIDWSIDKPIVHSKCKECGTIYQVNTKELFCSDKCRKDHQSPFKGKEKEFLDFYSELGSMNKALKAMGYPGAVSHYYKWAKSLI